MASDDIADEKQNTKSFGKTQIIGTVFCFFFVLFSMFDVPFSIQRKFDSFSVHLRIDVDSANGLATQNLLLLLAHFDEMSILARL